MKKILENFLIRTARFWLSVYWKIFKPVTLGVRCIVIDEQDRILLVRHRGTNQWFLPGGMIQKNETLSQAAARELEEETGVKVVSSLLRLFGCYTATKEGKRDYVIVYSVSVNSSLFLPKTCLEIDQIDFFSYGKLPSGISPGTQKRIDEYLDKQPLSDRW